METQRSETRWIRQGELGPTLDTDNKFIQASSLPLLPAPLQTIPPLRLNYARNSSVPDSRSAISRVGMDADGTVRTLVARDATDPCWDPAGGRIAFVKRLSTEKTIDYQNTGLFMYDIHRRKTEDLTGGKLYHAYVPCWSPTGDWIVVTVHEYAEFDHAIVAVDLRNKQIYSLKECGINGCRPDLSWDDKLICWNPNDIQIGVASFNPTCADRLPLRAIAQAPSPHGSVYFGDWSPDGKYIAYAMNPNVNVTNPGTGALWDIFVTKVEGGPSVQLTFDHANNKQHEFFSPV